jgi:hypothetical protein
MACLEFLGRVISSRILWEILRGSCGSLFCRALAELLPHHLSIKYQTQKDLDGGLI